MERFQEELLEAGRQLRNADHLVSITHRLVGDNRLLLSAVESLSSAARGLVASLLHYEQAFKRLPRFSEDPGSMIYWFRARCLQRYGLDDGYARVAIELAEIVNEHRKSAIEFSRKDCFVICSDTYRIRKVSLQQIKDYAEVVKRMLADVEGVVLGYEGVFGRGARGVKAR